MMQSYQVAKIGIDSMLKGIPSKIPGFLNQLVAFSLRFTPRKMMASAAYLLMKN